MPIRDSPMRPRSAGKGTGTKGMCRKNAAPLLLLETSQLLLRRHEQSTFSSRRPWPDTRVQHRLKVSTVYFSGERHLVFDSDFGFAGGRVYGDPLYDVETAGLDENFSLYVR